MAVIGHSPRIFAYFCLGVFAISAWADVHGEVVDLFASMTTALSDDNANGFMAAFDKGMPDYDKLNAEINALLEEAELSADIEIVKEQGDAAQRSVDLDWYLEIKSRQVDGPLIRRREVIHCDLRKEKKDWKITGLSPLGFFAPADFSKPNPK